MNAEQKILTCRILLSQLFPFYSYLLCFLKTKPAKGLSYNTLETDGVYIYYDVDFVNSLSIPQLCFALIHETMHVACKHFRRQGKRVFERWRQAVDFAVNAILMKEKSRWVEPIKGILYDSKYDTWAAETIYNDLEDKNTIGNPLDGGCLCGSRLKPMDQELDSLWNSRLYGAAQAALRQGKLPAGFERLVDDLTVPEIDWRMALHQFVNQFKRDDYTFSRPNRMHLYRGIILPSAYSKGIGTIVLVFDTSSSMSKEQLTQMVAEAQEIRNTYDTDMHVIACDAKVQNHYILEKYEYFDTDQIKLTGGGGTDFSPAFEYIEKENLRPTAVVYMSDGKGVFPNPPEYPVLWALTKDHDAPPFGRHLVVNV